MLRTACALCPRSRGSSGLLPARDFSRAATAASNALVRTCTLLRPSTSSDLIAQLEDTARKPADADAEVTAMQTLRVTKKMSFRTKSPLAPDDYCRQNCHHGRLCLGAGGCVRYGGDEIFDAVPTFTPSENVA